MRVFAALLFLLVCAGTALAEGGKGYKDQQSRIKAMDTNNDGQVSSQEFQGPQDQFSQMDNNRDGSLDRQEQQRLAQSWTDQQKQSRGRMSEQGRTGEQHYPQSKSSEQSEQMER